MDIIKQHVLTNLSKGMREDGRQFMEYRPILVEYGISPKSSEGSARVKIGGTEVVVGVKMEIMEPYSDKPDEGSLMINAELLPLSNPDFESGPPAIESIELARVVDRGLREGKAVDFKKLCIKVGEKMWVVVVDIYPLNDEGNLFDAASLGALAAIKDAKFPIIENDHIQYGKLSDKKLPVQHLPLECTVWKIGNTFIVDPGKTEEASGEARLTIAVLEDGTICALQKGGDKGLSFQDIEKMVDIAIEKTAELRGHL